MLNRIPPINTQIKICVICEGQEDYYYLNKLTELKVFDKCYKLSLVDAGGNGNIPARYQDKFQNGSYDLVLVFCDTEKPPYEQYFDIKRKIDDFHGIEQISNHVVIYSNPCTMQIVANHWESCFLKKPAKSLNSKLIQKHTGVENYKAREDQVKIVMSSISVENYNQMKERIKNHSVDETELGGTNILYFLDCLEQSDLSWVTLINNKIFN